MDCEYCRWAAMALPGLRKPADIVFTHYVCLRLGAMCALVLWNMRTCSGAQVQLLGKTAMTMVSALRTCPATVQNHVQGLQPPELAGLHDQGCLLAMEGLVETASPTR